MKTLLVEDDENKRDDVKRFLEDTYPSWVVDCAGSYQAALKRLLTQPYELVVLDMTIPTFDKGVKDSAGRLRPLGGTELLDQLARRKISTAVIILTGYDMLGDGERAVPLEKVVRDIRSKFAAHFRGAVFYSRSEDRWRTQLKECIELVEVEQ